ncbi:TPA: DUF4303 domain-containing protein [Escherichia coli]|nr:DUF4303 domain-containing protein [Escherichia coli]
MKIEKGAIISQITAFTEQEISKFLQEHPGLTFYAFALDCNVEYGEVNLCLNTEAGFEKSLSYYKDSDPEHYSSSEAIFDLKYNTGDWDYQCFATTYLFSDDEQMQITEEDRDAWLVSLLQICNESLDKITKTPAFKQISKTKDFISFCIDHDEDVVDAVRKTNPSCL